jgi:tRNA(fMet)-specific endonuclease VapC
MSQRYLLDTNIISNMMRDANGMAARRFERVAKEVELPYLCTSVVVECELRFGMTRKPNPRLELAYDLVMQSLEILPLGSEVADRYAQVRTALERLGTPIGPNDTLIAAHALALDCALVTGNEEEFRRVPGLRVENWLVEEKQF